jgi:hypothetical protein
MLMSTPFRSEILMPTNIGVNTEWEISMLTVFWLEIFMPALTVIELEIFSPSMKWFAIFVIGNRTEMVRKIYVYT